MNAKLFGKSTLAILLSASFALTAFTGCRSKKEDPEIIDTETTTETAAETTTETAEETTAETPAGTETTAPEETFPEYNDSAMEALHFIDGQVLECGRADKSYFDDTVFVGDSISNYMGYYATATGKLGNAQFLTSGSLSATNALWEISDESVHPSYQGVKMLVEDAVAACGAKKLYIMLGMNDLGINTLEEAKEKYVTLLDRIIEKSPGIQICIESMTPMLCTERALTDKYLNNTNIEAYNKILCALCAERGWSFINVASVMYAEDGFLKPEYCSDPTAMGIHPSNAGCDRWIDYLYTHTPQLVEFG